mgnify:CR=1 FL=1
MQRLLQRLFALERDHLFLGDEPQRLVLAGGRRDDIVLATKVSGRMHDGPTGGGLSRSAIHAQCDASLRRLGTDVIDLYFIHRYDDSVPVEETMEALHDLVVAGKVPYLGGSEYTIADMAAWPWARSPRPAT